MPKPHSHRLPNELLAEIFILCIPRISRLYFFDIDNRLDKSVYPHVALQLSQVCSRWRGVALSTSYLWSQIVIMSSQSKGLRNAAKASSLLEWTSHYLKHSKNQPLEIALQSPADDLTPFLMQPLYHTLLEESQRWKWVHFNLYYPHIEELSIPQSLPMLEFVHFHVNSLMHVFNFPSLIAPRLRDIALSEIMITRARRKYVPALEALTKSCPSLVNIFLLHASAVFALECLLFAPSCCLSIDLVPGLSGPFSEFEDWPVTASISALVTNSKYTVDDQSNDPLYDLLNNILSLPNVHLLDFTGGRFSGRPFPHAPLISFLSRRRPNETPITKFSLKRWILKDEYLLQILELLPALEHLVIDEKIPKKGRRRGRTLSSSFLRALRVPPNGSASKWFLPHLRNLTLTFGQEVDYEALTDLIRSRQGVDISGLEQVSISVPRKLVDIEGIELLRVMDSVVVELV
ncbi:hypothetical protein VKT23_007663 [Stygiomarasmius scandens]|uniref:F-box domain-containing protein n=1 Tax=Marasmiellus scandens TaxID=2682957 RepID=A0ABR1JL90_9AGAR